MALPQLTDEQRKAALEKAAAARHARAELREKIKKGETTLESVLNSDDPIASRMKVSTLIESLPGYGKAKRQDHGRAGHFRHPSRSGPGRPSARAAPRAAHQVSGQKRVKALCDFRAVRRREGNAGRARA
mgnify:CR=1 FL=1